MLVSVIRTATYFININVIAYRGEKRCIQVSGVEIRGKETAWKNQA
jgi:hypothetical protein